MSCCLFNMHVLVRVAAKMVNTFLSRERRGERERQGERDGGRERERERQRERERGRRCGSVLRDITNTK